MGRIAKRKRWVCPKCDDGLLAPSKPRMDDVRRYCLPCSEATGRLVQRTCLSKDRERQVKQEREAAKRQRTTVAKKMKRAKAAAKREEERITAKEEEAARWIFGGVNLKEEAKRLVKLKAWRGAFHLSDKRCLHARWSRIKPWKRIRRGYFVPDINLQIRRKGTHTSGRSYGGRIAMTLPAGCSAARACALLIHELAHEALPRNVWHAERFWLLLFEAAHEAYGADLAPCAYSNNGHRQDALRDALKEKFDDKS